MKRVLQVLLACIALNNWQVFAQNIVSKQTYSGTPLKEDEYDLAYNAYNAGYYKTAFDSAMKRAENGDPAAQTLLAILYMEGRNIAQDANRAMYWYARAADAGDPQAQLRYGIDIYNGFHVQKDQKKGEEYIRKAMRARVSSAYFYYGKILMERAEQNNRFDVGLHWFLKGAAAGDINAAYAASRILAEGTPKIARYDKAARIFLEAAANGGSIVAQMELARWMIEGRGGMQDHRGAFDLMKIVSVHGLPSAQISLARLYYKGIGTKNNLIMAAAWYTVAKQGNLTAEDLENLLEGLSEEQMKRVQTRIKTLLTNP